VIVDITCPTRLFRGRYLVIGVDVQITCIECGKPFDDRDQCSVCLARNKAMKRTFYLCFLAGLGGFVSMMFMIPEYPPIGSLWWVAYSIVGLIVIPAVIVFVLYDFDRLTRYATFAMMMGILVATSLVALAAFFYLNGSLDRNPPVETEARLDQKFIEHGRYGPGFFLRVTFTWNGERFEYDDLAVSEESYTATRPGDSVRVIVHPGKFSLPWYSGVLPQVNRESGSK
jgi:hypothetical protein